MKIETPDKELARIKRLIDAASETCGGQNKLAAAIGYPKGVLSNWASGREPCPAKAQAAMAHFAGLDAVEVMALATVEHERNPQRKEALIRALGKRFAPVGAVACFALFATATPAPTQAHSLTSDRDTMCRHVKRRTARRQRRLMRIFHQSKAPQGLF